jgi:hypothetical protein
VAESHRESIQQDGANHATGNPRGQQARADRAHPLCFAPLWSAMQPDLPAMSPWRFRAGILYESFVHPITKSPYFVGNWPVSARRAYIGKPRAALASPPRLQALQQAAARFLLRRCLRQPTMGLKPA